MHLTNIVERDGESRSFHVANVKAKTLREKIVKTVSRKSHLMTDELASYWTCGFPASSFPTGFTVRPTMSQGSNRHMHLLGPPG
jgi:hypothetical protein